MIRISFVLFVLLVSVASPAKSQQHVHPQSERLGTVHFATSCTETAQPQFDRAVALLHSFEFGAAIEAFEDTLTADPSCAMTQWGIALSRWGNPFAVGVRPPRSFSKGGPRWNGPLSWREVRARARLYRRGRPALRSNRTARSRRASGLSRRDGRAGRAIATTRSGDLLRPVADRGRGPERQDLRQPAARRRHTGAAVPAQPEHPGLAHYIIHSYDVPPLAPRALDAAQRYAQIAPSAPHALHMPSHTFTRVGLWQQSIDTNIQSAAAAKEQEATGEELHASDYQMYAFLQTAQDTAAKRLLESLPEIAARFDPRAISSAAPPSAGCYAMAAIPARLALERGAWAEAARLEVRPSVVPYADALTEFARVLGAARSGDIAAARAGVERLERCGFSKRH